MNREPCLFARSTSLNGSDHSKPVDLKLYILDGVSKTANRRIFPRILHVLDIPSHGFHHRFPIVASTAHVSVLVGRYLVQTH